MTSLADLIKYIISRLVDMDSSFGKTKLIKLLYLSDVEYYKLSGQTITGLNWFFHYYGPYAFEIDEALKQLDLEIPQEDTKTASGHKAKVFRPSRDLSSDFEETSGLEKSVVDRVTETWGLEELNTLLNHVYFHTEPMENVQRGDVLDFSSVRRFRGVGGPSKIVSISPQVKREIRQKFEKVMEKRPGILNLDPKPRFDSLFWNELTSLNLEEQPLVRPGEVEMDEASKKEIRDQSGQE